MPGLAVSAVPGDSLSTNARPENDTLTTLVAQSFSLPGSVFSIDYNSRGSMLAAAGRGSAVHLLLPLLGTTLKTMDGFHKDDVRTVEFSPDDRLLATGSADRSVIVWDVASARALRVMNAHENYINDVSWSPDGEILASAGRDGRLIFWIPGTGNILKEAERAPHGLTSVSFSPDGFRVAVAGTDGSVSIYNTVDLTLVHKLKGHSGDVSCVEWSKRSGLVASGSWDDETRIWNAYAGHKVSVLRGHTTDVNCLAFSPDGTVLATSGGDMTIKLWDLPTGQEIITIREGGHTTDVEDISFNHNGTQLATCSRDGKINVWTVPSLEERFNAAIKTEMDKWKVKGIYEKTTDYEKRMGKSVRHVEEVRAELENQLADFYESNIDWRSDLTFRTYNADGEYFPLTSPLFGSLKITVKNDDAPVVAENIDRLIFKNLNLRVRKGRMELRRFVAELPGTNKRFVVTPL